VCPAAIVEKVVTALRVGASHEAGRRSGMNGIRTGYTYECEQEGQDKDREWMKSVESRFG
jgi:hypothetical protein